MSFQVNQDYLQCEDFLIGDIRVGDYRHFIFATEKQLSLLRAAKRWYMDGTFKVLSDPWKRQGQLFSIHAFIEKDGQSQQFPLAFCIMSRKTIADYKEVFRVLMDKLGRVDVEGFVVDFESGWHHRLNSKAGTCGLGFYRLVPLLRREATLMEMALRAGDLQRDTRGAYRRLETRLQDFWTKYLDHEMSTTAFLRACGSLYGVRLTAPAPEADD